MIHSSHRSLAVTLALMLSLAAPTAAIAQDAAFDNHDRFIKFLHKLGITDQADVLQTLQAVKLALKRPYTLDPADADLMVCRIDRGLVDAREFLDCSTNHDHRLMQDQTQLAYMEAQAHAGRPASQGGFDISVQAIADTQATLERVAGKMPDNHLYVAVNGASLQKLLDRLPAPEPAQQR